MYEVGNSENCDVSPDNRGLMSSLLAMSWYVWNHPEDHIKKYHFGNYLASDVFKEILPKIMIIIINTFAVIINFNLIILGMKTLLLLMKILRTVKKCKGPNQLILSDNFLQIYYKITYPPRADLSIQWKYGEIIFSQCMGKIFWPVFQTKQAEKKKLTSLNIAPGSKSAILFSLEGWTQC
jgi:hypothetical protein